MAHIRHLPEAGRVTCSGSAGKGLAPEVSVYIQHRDAAGTGLILTPEEARTLALELPVQAARAEEHAKSEKDFAEREAAKAASAN